MEIGERIKTSAGELIILDIQEKYLILFNDLNRQFIKANGYQKALDDNYFWNGGEYYPSLNELLKSL